MCSYVQCIVTTYMYLYKIGSSKLDSLVIRQFNLSSFLFTGNSFVFSITGIPKNLWGFLAFLDKYI